MERFTGVDAEMKPIFEYVYAHNYRYNLLYVCMSVLCGCVYIKIL